MITLASLIAWVIGHVIFKTDKLNDVWILVAFFCYGTSIFCIAWVLVPWIVSTFP